MGEFAIGQSVLRREDPRLLRGQGRFFDDLKLADQLHAAIVRSPHAHADIIGIDTRAALQMPGVHAVLTGADYRGDGLGSLPSMAAYQRRGGGPMFLPPRPAIAFDRVMLMSAVIALNVWLYRLSGGRMMGTMAGAPILLLTTTGRRSRRERTVPVLYLEDGGRFVMVASLAGAPQNPAWFLNLEADPRVRLQVRSRRLAATARRASAEEKAQLWPRLVAMYPAYEDYQKRTTRDIPVVIATPA